MEAIYDLIDAFQFNALELAVACLIIFSIGYKLGTKKVSKLNDEIYGLQKDVLDLNAEILFGKNGPGSTETPVIEIKHDALKTGKLAK
ncbi:MAG: hypothetical protein ACHQET_07565 [Chitinophagales bacterium]